MLVVALLVVAGALQYLDLVAVGILYEEEASEHLLATFEFFDGGRREPYFAQASVMEIKVFYCEGDMAIATAVGVAVLALVPGQFDFGAALLVAQVHEGEVVELKAMGFLQVECLSVETHGGIQVTYTDHGVEEFRHDQAFLWCCYALRMAA